MTAGSSDPLERELRTALLERPEVLEAYLFGSQARGDASAHSDVDVAVYVDPTAPVVANALFGYPAELTTALMAALRRNDIDVVVLNSAPPLLYHRVLRDGHRLFARDLKATTVRETYAFSRYCAPYKGELNAGSSGDDQGRARSERRSATSLGPRPRSSAPREASWQVPR